MFNIFKPVGLNAQLVQYSLISCNKKVTILNGNLTFVKEQNL